MSGGSTQQAHESWCLASYHLISSSPLVKKMAERAPCAPIATRTWRSIAASASIKVKTPYCLPSTSPAALIKSSCANMNFLKVFSSKTIVVGSYPQQQSCPLWAWQFLSRTPKFFGEKMCAVLNKNWRSWVE